VSTSADRRDDDVDALPLRVPEGAVEVAEVPRVAHRDDLASGPDGDGLRLQLRRVAHVELLDVLGRGAVPMVDALRGPEDDEEDDRERDAPLRRHPLGHEVHQRRGEEHEEDEASPTGSSHRLTRTFSGTCQARGRRSLKRRTTIKSALKTKLHTTPKA
jgi:hypothetical protein